MNTSEAQRIQHSSTVFSESVLSTPSLQAPTPFSTNDVDDVDHPRYIPVDPFRNPRTHNYLSTTIDDIPVYPSPKPLRTHQASTPTEPPHGVYTPPRSPRLRPEVTGSTEMGRQPSHPRLFTHAHDSLPMYHAHSASPPRRLTVLERIHARTQHLPSLFCEALPRKCYVYLLLGLPEVYFARVARVFKCAGLSMSEIKRMALESSQFGQGVRNEHVLLSPWSPLQQQFSPTYHDLEGSWDKLVDALVKEWSVSAVATCVILCAILLVLQQDVGGLDPVTRYLVLFSSICCLLSLVYSCIYTLRFGIMRDKHRIAEWAFEAQKIRTHLLWNLWIFLSLPAAFLGWSILLLTTSILSLTWRTSPSPALFPPVDKHTSSGLRAFITILFVLGLVYLVLILRMFRRFGEPMDEAWEERVKVWNVEKRIRGGIGGTGVGTQLATPAIPSCPLSPDLRAEAGTEGREVGQLQLQLPSPVSPDEATSANPNLNGNGSGNGEDRRLSPVPEVLLVQPEDRASTLHDTDSVPFLEVININLNIAQDSTSKFALNLGDYNSPYLQSATNYNSPYLQPATCKASKILDMRSRLRPMMPPEPVVESGISVGDWRKFVNDIFTAWDLHGITRIPTSSSSSDDLAEDDIGSVLEKWNAATFSSVGIQALLCQEFPFPSSASKEHEQTESFSVYIIECDRSVPLVERFGAVPEGLCRIDICDPLVKHFRTSLVCAKGAGGGVRGSDSSLSLEVVA